MVQVFPIGKLTTNLEIALDAHANTVEVSVDLEQSAIEVHGITRLRIQI